MNILQDIYASTLRFLAPLNVDETYKIVVEEAIKLVNGQHGSVLLEVDGELKRVYATDPLLFNIKTRKRGLRYKVFKSRKAMVLHVEDVKKLGKEYPPLIEMRGKSIIMIPLSNKGKAIGLLTVNSLKDRYFSDNDVETLKLFGSLAHLAIRKAQLYDELKDTLNNRDMFISLAAHELRTPLTSVLGYFQLLKLKIEQKKNIPKKWLDDMDFETKRLNQIVEEFLEINKIRTGKLQYDFKETKLRVIIKRSIYAFKFTRPDRKTVFADRMTSQQNDRIIGDQDKLIQVITNVLENAAKYSPTNTKIQIKLRYIPPDYILEVIDNGKGISENEIPLIFKGFYKGKNSMHEGMGLGLYLAKRIIDDHHGSILLKSKLNKGTTIQIRLPKIQE